jgi:hypothetical protein
MAGICGQAIKLWMKSSDPSPTGNTGSSVRIAIIVDILNAQHREDAEIVHRFGHF